MWILQTEDSPIHPRRRVYSDLEVDRKGSLDDRKEKELVSGTREGKSEDEDRRVEKIRQEARRRRKN